MNIKVKDLMAERVVTATPHQTVGHIKSIMTKAGFHAIPVSGPNGEPVGIVTTTDLLRDDIKDTTEVATVMTSDVTTVPIYESISTAARVMRRRRIHHLVVVHEKKIAGILSTFDVLKLIEEHRFVSKEKPKRPGRPRAPSTRREGRHRG